MMLVSLTTPARMFGPKSTVTSISPSRMSLSASVVLENPQTRHFTSKPPETPVRSALRFVTLLWSRPSMPLQVEK